MTSCVSPRHRTERKGQREYNICGRKKVLSKTSCPFTSDIRSNTKPLRRQVTRCARAAGLFGLLRFEPALLHFRPWERYGPDRAGLEKYGTRDAGITNATFNQVVK